MKELFEKIEAYIYVYGEATGIAFILSPFGWDMIKRLLFGFYEPVWYSPAIASVGIGLILLIWSKHTKQ